MNWLRVALSAACGVGLVVVALLHNGWVAVVCTVINGVVFTIAEMLAQRSISLSNSAKELLRMMEDRT